MKKKINVIMPIAGLGSRFSNVGITTPKPLISLLGKHMVEWAADSLPFIERKNFIFIVRKEHIDSHKIDQELKRLFHPEVKIIVIDHLTEGAACTVLLAKNLINNQTPLIITDCDHYFESKLYEQFINDPTIDGVIPVKDVDPEPKWSFCRTNSDMKVIEIAEKKPISRYANIGAYYFKTGEYFVHAAERMIAEDRRVNGEFYIAPVYEMLIEEGKHIKAALCDRGWWIGTPEDVEVFLKDYSQK